MTSETSQGRCLAALAVLSGASAGLAKGPSESEVKAIRQVILDEKTVGKALPVWTARNLLTTTVKLPDDMTEPSSCGDCTDGHGSDPDALFRVEPVAQGRYLPGKLGTG
jgi:hypothetical protein